MALRSTDCHKLKNCFCAFIWKIENFNFCPHNSGEYLDSPIFIVSSFCGTQWFLRLYPRGNGENRNISCYLHRNMTDIGPPEVLVDFQLQVRGSSDTLAIEKSDSFTFSKGSSSGFEDFIIESSGFRDSEFFIPNGTFTLRCRLQSESIHSDFPQTLFASTVIELEKYRYEWTIRNAIESKAKMQPFPGTSKFEMCSEYREVKFTFGELHFKRFTGLFKYKILRLDDLENVQVLRQSEQFMKDSDSFKIPSLTLPREHLFSGYQVVNSMRLGCEISISYLDNKNDDSESTVSDEISHLKELINENNQKNENYALSDFQKMYNERKMTDVILVVDEKKFHAHRFVLAARSEVFSKMFEQDMVENQTGEVEISDLDAETFNLFLNYLYGESITFINLDEAEKLLFAAEKYYVPTLKEICACILSLNITDESVCRMLNIADMTLTKSLKEASLSYFKLHAHDILERQEWRELRKDNLELAVEILTEFAKEVPIIKIREEGK